MKPEFKPRRLYDEDDPDSWLESDTDFFENNRELILWLLEKESNKTRYSIRSIRSKHPDGWSANSGYKLFDKINKKIIKSCTDDSLEDFLALEKECEELNKLWINRRHNY